MGRMLEGRARHKWYILVYMSFINEVCRALNENGVRYAVVGGYAVALHGAVRGTMDVDIVVNWNLGNLRLTEKALAGIGLLPRLPIGAEDVFRFRDEYIDNRNLIAWNFVDSADVSRQVNVIITYDLKGRRRQRLETQSGPVHILGLTELIDMKRDSGRPQDLADLAALEELK